VGALAATLEEGIRRHLATASRRAPLVSGALGLVYLGAILPDGLTALAFARKTGGRFNEKGLIIYPDLDKQAALAHLARELPEDASLGVDASMKQMYWMDWVLRRPVGPMPFPRLAQPLGHSHYALDLRFASLAQARSLVQSFRTRTYGPFLVAYLGSATTPLEGFALVRREPSFLERWLVSSSHALYDVVPDPFVAWEVRTHLDDEAPPPPERRPTSFEDLRIAHNVALARGHEASAKDLRQRLLAGTNREVAREYTNGIELLGSRFERGASELLTVYFSAPEPLAEAHSFGIVSYVEAAPAWSLTPPDRLPRDVGMPFALPSSVWRPGFIYAATTEILKRPGRERYAGAFRGRGAPVPVSGPGEVVLLTLS
jgi:hypothetical protein